MFIITSMGIIYIRINKRIVRGVVCVGVCWGGGGGGVIVFKQSDFTKSDSDIDISRRVGRLFH